MDVKTRIFGEISLDDDKVLTFEDGIIGFENFKKYALIYNLENEDQNTISWLQSLEDGDIAFPVIDPLAVTANYNPSVEEEVLKKLGPVENDEDYHVLVTITVPKDIKDISINLRAPIIINTNTKKSCQIILDSSEYPIRFPIYDLIKPEKEGK